jgi:hypothetical protein
MTLLRDVFRDRIISKNIWPPRSPDFASSACYLWGAIKGVVYKENPHTLLDVKEAIADFMKNVHLFEMPRVFVNRRRHVDACLQARGGYFQLFL